MKSTPDIMKPLAWLLFVSALIATVLTITGCVLDDPFINAELQAARVGHLQNMAAAQSAPTPSLAELARLKAANYQAPAPR